MPNENANQLIPVERGVSVWDRIHDPLAFVDAMGKVFAHAGACGCQTEQQGKLLALACLSERKSIFELDRTYHMIDGKLSMKYDAMLAEMRRLGGKHRWIKDGTDGISAEIELKYDGQMYVSKYTMEDAQRAKLVREGGGWTKNPANMLRARAASNGVRMLAPEICSGTYTPEEREDIRNESEMPRRTQEQVEQRREEIKKGPPEQVPFQVKTPIDSPKTDSPETTHEGKPPPTEKKAQSDESAESTNQTLNEIDDALLILGMNREDVEAKLGEKIKDLSSERQGRLLANLHTKISEEQVKSGN